MANPNNGSTHSWSIPRTNHYLRRSPAD